MVCLYIKWEGRENGVGEEGTRLWRTLNNITGYFTLLLQRCSSSFTKVDLCSGSFTQVTV